MFCPLEPAWGDIGTWVSGIATLLTAGLAIYLARRPERIRLKAKAGFFLIFGTGAAVDPEILSVSVTNVGLRKTIVKQIVIRTGLSPWGRWRYRFAVIPNWGGLYTGLLPATIGDGESVSLHMDMEPGRPFVANLVENGFVRRKVDVWSFRFGIQTGHHRTIYVKPDDDFQKALSEALDLHRKVAQRQ